MLWARVVRGISSIRDRGDPRGREPLCGPCVGERVQERDQNGVFGEGRDLGIGGRLHLDDHVGSPQSRGGVGRHGSAGRSIELVREGGARTRTRLYDDLDHRLLHLADCIGDQGDPPFVRARLAEDGDLHEPAPWVLESESPTVGPGSARGQFYRDRGGERNVECRPDHSTVEPPPRSTIPHSFDNPGIMRLEGRISPEVATALKGMGHVTWKSSMPGAVAAR